MWTSWRRRRQTGGSLSVSDPDEIIEVLDLGSARGGARPESGSLICEVVRSLGPEDLPRLIESQGVDSPRQEISRLRSSHHSLARILALGETQTDAALATGYSISYISILQGDPTFKGLVEYYREEREALFVDAIQRLKSLGIDAVEEIQARLAEDPAGWTKRELMDLARLTLVDPMKGGGGGDARPQGGVTVNVQFVDRKPRGGPVVVPSDVVDLETQDGE